MKALKLDYSMVRSPSSIAARASIVLCNFATILFICNFPCITQLSI